MKVFFRIVIVQLILICAVTVNTKAQNLINNPGFENGIIGWAKNQNNGAGVTFTTDTTNSPQGNKHLVCKVSKLGSNDWDIQLRSNSFPVDQTHQYSLTFKAKAKSKGDILKVYIQKNSWMGKSFTLTDSWETYTYEFFPNENSKELKFNFVEVSDYYIDDIVLKDNTPVNNDFNTPPSCVITAPYVNAYYKVGNKVVINAYSTDIGGSGLWGEVEKVEFYIDDLKIGESNTANQSTYSLEWTADNTGEYRVTAVATDSTGKSFTSAGVLFTVGEEDVKAIGLSSGKGKYLGNVVRNSGPEATFTEYWNGVTSGNGGKWQTVERTRNLMRWSMADQAYNLAKDNNLPYRYHTLAWGSQYPSWIKTLPPATFQAEMEQFIKAVADRYPLIDQIDVINEALPGHQEDTKYFINGLGGAGESGYDWAVWLFKKAREYFPNAKLVLNDFAIVNSASNIRQQMLLLKVLRDSALVDGFGAQAHQFNLDGMNANQLKSNLDLMTEAGVPIYLTEMDMQGSSTTESSQLTSYKNLFPVMWEHPHVAGITLWGYVFDNMWKPKAGLVYANGNERSSMIWLKDYMEQQENVGYPLANQIPSNTRELEIVDSDFLIYPNPTSGMIYFNKELEYRIFNLTGSLIYEGKSQKVDLSELQNGIYIVETNNSKVKILKK